MSRKLSAGKCTAFTLIELLIVLAVLSILLSLAAPHLRGLVEATQVRMEVSRLQRAVILARSEAVARNQAVSLCPSSFSRSEELKCNGDYRDGWLVFVKPDPNSSDELDSAALIRAFEPMPAGFWLSDSAGKKVLDTRISYSSDGSTGRNLTMRVCAQGAAAKASWSVVINRVGRPRLARTWGACPGAV